MDYWEHGQLESKDWTSTLGRTYCTLFCYKSTIYSILSFVEHQGTVEIRINRCLKYKKCYEGDKKVFILTVFVLTSLLYLVLTTPTDSQIETITFHLTQPCSSIE